MRRGYTLIEMLVAVSAIALAASLLATIHARLFVRDREVQTAFLIRQRDEGCERYRNEDLGRSYPGPATSRALRYHLGRDRDPFPHWKTPDRMPAIIDFGLDPGPSVATADPVIDAFGNELRYVPGFESVVIHSAGADGRFEQDGGGNDIVNGNLEGVID